MPMIQAASFLFKENEKTWNFCRVPRLVGVEDDHFRVPYIEGKIWGNSPHTKLKEGMSSKINFQFPREPSTSKSAPPHKGAIEYIFWKPKWFALSPKKKVLMTMHLAHQSARSVPWVDEETLAPIGKQDSTSHDVGPRTSKLAGFWGAIVGPKDLGTPAHLISSLRPTPGRKKCSRTNEGNPDC